MKTLNALLIAAGVALVLGASSGDAKAGTATGHSRPVDIWLLDTFLSHTYEDYNGWWAPGNFYGYYTSTFGGDASGGSNTRSSGVSNDAAEWNCILNHSTDLTYAVTGVCHQGTDRALQQTPVPYVNGWGVVDGSGVSYSMFGHFGAWFPWGPTYGSPC
jgi:hypothetical protein